MRILFHCRAIATSLPLALVAAPLATQVVPFPLAVTSRDAGLTELHPVPGALAGVARAERAVFTGVPTVADGVVALDVRRVVLRLAPGAMHVDGRPVPGWRDDSLSLWSGRVLGEDDSQVFLAFCDHGCRGWYGRPGALNHLLAKPGPNGDWSRASVLLVDDRTAPSAPPLGCQVLTPPGPPPPVPPPAPQTSSGPLPYYDAPIAFETDYEFYALFNDIAAAQAYALAQIGSVSDRYREQNGVIFTLPYVGFWTTNTDPWTSNDCSGRLTQFRTTWRNGGAPVTAPLYHLISGVPVSGCGGVAYLNVICNQAFGFGMSAHINGRLTFPPVQGPLTWDYFVLAHELGHQFGTPHTHDYNPQIDNCAGGDCSVVPNGTIMSYCHTCAGGMNNINLTFHSRVAAVIRSTVEGSCLVPFDGVITEDLGEALLGSNGTPAQDVSFVSPRVQIDVASAPRNEAGALFIGFREMRIAFLGGGTLVPSLDLVLPLVSNAAGDASTSFAVLRSFPAGLTSWMHSWFLDASGPNFFAASNATRVELIRP